MLIAEPPTAATRQPPSRKVVLTVTDMADAASAKFEQRVSQRVEQIVENRAVIDQAKGMLMFVLGCDAQAAFDELREQSQRHNVKLHLIAERIVGDLVELSKSKPTIDRLDSHGILLTAHQRIADVATKQANGESITA